MTAKQTREHFETVSTQPFQQHLCFYLTPEPPTLLPPTGL